MKRGECVCLSLAFICVCVSQSSAAIALGESFAKEVLHMPTLVDWGIGAYKITHLSFTKKLGSEQAR